MDPLEPGRISSLIFDMFTLKTDHPVAFRSLDHLALVNYKQGAPFINNSRSTDFNQQLQDWLKCHSSRSVLDIGCAGGGMVHDMLEMGIDAVGLEGSDYCLKNQVREWPLIPGNLFTCDVTNPFTLFKDGVAHQFDVVTAWEFMEHIEEVDLPGVMQNINNHTRLGSLFICSIAEFSSLVDGVDMHRTIHNRKWWKDVFFHFGWQEDPVADLQFSGHKVRTGSHNLVLKK